jgi:DNA-directed RNA polymerase, mitochondrial
MLCATVVTFFFNYSKSSTEEQPAFNHAYEYIRGRKLGVIKLNPEIAKHFAQPGAGTILHPRHLPMLVPPRPWVGHQDGAYIYNKSKAMLCCVNLD